MGDALLFCDDDDEAATGWLSAMGEALAQHDFVAGRMETDKLNKPEIRDSRRNPQVEGVQSLRFPPYAPIAAGCTLGIKRGIHEAVGGFDEDLPAHEDTFYCVKVHLLGIKLHFVPNAVLHYRYRTRFWDIYKQAHSYGYYYTLIYKKCRTLGMPKEPTRWSGGITLWKYILRTIPRIRRSEQALKLAFPLGYCVGRLKGSIVHQVVLI
jgi:GT2 family glycosyltransferase